MFSNEFSLHVISQHTQFKNLMFKEYAIQGEKLPLIGVYGDEPYDLFFRNSTNQKVQVRLSIDGTDVTTMKKAHTKPTPDGMWVVQPYDTLKLSAWVETTHKGRQFIFSNSGNEVAKLTHGDLSHRGIIAAAVFKDAHHYTTREHQWQPWKGVNFNKEEYTLSSNSVEEGYCSVRSPLRASPGTGAGQEVIQKIGTAIGLQEPCLTDVLAIKYCWYDELVDKVKKSQAKPSQHPGFPGDEEDRYHDLSYIPVTGKVDKNLISRFM